MLTLFRYQEATKAEIALKQTPIPSPSDAPTSFISEPYLAFLPAPVFLVAPSGLEESFRVLLESVDSNLRRLVTEGGFYRLATSVLPAFAEAVGEPAGGIIASALFDFAGLQTQAWALPAGSYPELHMRARLTKASEAASGQPVWVPGFTGELKTAGNRHGIEQGVLFTTRDIVRVFFLLQSLDRTTRTFSICHLWVMRSSDTLMSPTC